MVWRSIYKLLFRKSQRGHACLLEKTSNWPSPSVSNDNAWEWRCSSNAPLFRHDISVSITLSFYQILSSGDNTSKNKHKTDEHDLTLVNKKTNPRQLSILQLNVRSLSLKRQCFIFTWTGCAMGNIFTAFSFQLYQQCLQHGMLQCGKSQHYPHIHVSILSHKQGFPGRHFQQPTRASDIVWHVLR